MSSEFSPAGAGLAVGFGGCRFVQNLKAHCGRGGQSVDHSGEFLPGCLDNGGTGAQDLQHGDLLWCERVEQPIDRALGEAHSRTGSWRSAGHRGEERRRNLRREAQPIRRRDPGGTRAPPTESESDLVDPGRRHAQWRRCPLPVQALADSQDVAGGAQAGERRLDSAARPADVANRHERTLRQGRDEISDLLGDRVLHARKT